jgi:hypothetical protein
LNGETIGVLRKQFPWLPDLLHEVNGEFKAQVLDLDALSLTVSAEYDFYRIYLVTKEGVKIGEVSREFRLRKMMWPFSWLAKMFGEPGGIHMEAFFYETLEDALKRLQPASKNLQFVLHLNGYHVTLYKVPKGVNFIEHMERKKAEVEAQLVAFLEDK